MGYDMTWKEVDPEERARVAAANAKFHEACRLRDSTEPDSLARTQAQKFVDETYAELRSTEKSYFRLNIWGMWEWRNYMVELGMVHDEEPTVEMPWPEPDDYGLSNEEFENFSDEGNTTDERYLRFEADMEAKRSWAHPIARGMAYWKFCSNDGWVVTPKEIEEALATWEEKGSPNPVDDDPSYWDKWIEYLRGAVTHGGFVVTVAL